MQSMALGERQARKWRFISVVSSTYVTLFIYLFIFTDGNLTNKAGPGSNMLVL